MCIPIANFFTDSVATQTTVSVRQRAQPQRHPVGTCYPVSSAALATAPMAHSSMLNFQSHQPDSALAFRMPSPLA